MTTKGAGSPFDLCNFVFADGRGGCMLENPFDGWFIART